MKTSIINSISIIILAITISYLSYDIRDLKNEISCLKAKIDYEKTGKALFPSSCDIWFFEN